MAVKVGLSELDSDGAVSLTRPADTLTTTPDFSELEFRLPS